MEDVVESPINKEWDIGVVYKAAGQAFDAKEYEKAIRLTEDGLVEAKQSNLGMWGQKFDKLNSDIKEKYLKTQIDRFLKRAQKEEGIFKHQSALDSYKKAEEALNSLFKLGKNEEKIKKKITKVKKKINELHEKINQDLAGGTEEISEKYEPKPVENPEDFIIKITPNSTIVIDGSNVAWNGGDRKRGDKPQLEVIVKLWKALKSLGFENIVTFCDFLLPKQIDDRRGLEKMIQEKRIIRRPNTKEADDMVLKYAKRKNGYIIVESEKYRDKFRRFDPSWINERRIEISYINGEIFFDPDIEVVEDNSELKEKKENIDVDYGEEAFYGSEKHEHKFSEGEEDTSDLNINQKIELLQKNQAKLKTSFPPKRILKPPKKVEKINPSLVEDFLKDDTPITPEKIETQSNLAKQRNREQSEKLNTGEMQGMIKKVKGDLEVAGYHIIPNNISFFRKDGKDIDILAVKIIEVKELLGLIIILPIKICNLKGSLTVSENYIDYRASEGYSKAKMTDVIKSSLVGPNIKGLGEGYTKIFEDITTEGYLFQYFKRYLKLKITVEKSKSSKRLFFHSGPLQYKVLIDPVLISQNEVGFTEKVDIKYPYQRSSNNHIIYSPQMPDLLEYLEEKYDIIEKNGPEETAISKYREAINKFTKSLKVYSLPFFLFGIIFMVVLLSQAYFLLNTFMGMGIAGISIYSIMLLYLSLIYYKKKEEIQDEFKMPYYLRPIKIDETDISLIAEDISSPEVLEQFIYECFGKDADFDLLIALEEKRDYKSIIRKKKSIRNEVNVKDFNKKTTIKGFSSNKLDEGIFEKYSSFLED